MSSEKLKIRIITSCTGDKLYAPPRQLTQSDFQHLLNHVIFAEREAELAAYRTKAQELYTGQQHLRLMHGIDALRDANNLADIETWIVSAGYGLIAGDREIVPYECTFQKMKGAEIAAWSNHLCIPQKARQIFAQDADLVLVLLGDSYLRALQLDNTVHFAAPTYFIVGSSKAAQVKGTGDVHKIKLETNDTRRFECGLVGLKGEVARRILVGIAEQGITFVERVRTDADILTDIAQPSFRPKMAISAMTMGKTDPRIDNVITIPQDWWDKPHRQQISYFIPDWDDTVDPDYDFETDTHSGGRGNWGNQVYAHQIYPTPNYDGILVSKAVIEKSSTKKSMMYNMGVHRYLRVPENFAVMGDCGAFSYVNQKEPPYTTSEILDYYTKLGFNYGVSIDHLLFGAATRDEQQYRYDLTIDNAKKFIEEHRKLGLSWTAIGAVQGWDPESYAKAAQAYVSMGYEYIAIGGLVRSQTEDILRIVEAVSQVVPRTVGVHLFGIARTKPMQTFINLGVTSVDSASYLRKAWMSINRSYLTNDGAYTTLRIPDVAGVIRHYQVRNMAFDEAQLQTLERNALSSLRSLAKGSGDIDNCIDALINYDEVARFGVRRDSLEQLARRYQATLQARPWEQCDCEICQSIGVEVVIFRGNNRNRRRGFHNTYVFYQVMQRLLTGQSVSPEWVSEMPASYQRSFFTFMENLTTTEAES